LGSFTCWYTVLGKKMNCRTDGLEQYGLGGEEKNAYLSVDVSELWSSEQRQAFELASASTLMRKGKGIACSAATNSVGSYIYLRDDKTA
jgi:hypothetical protein